MKLLLKPLIIALTIGFFTSTAQAQVSENHSSGDVDPNAPIVALDILQSLKEPTNLQVNLPKIQHFVTKAGTPVMLVQTHNLPIVDISLRFNAGSARDSSIKKNGYGLASLTASMLKQGSQQKNEDTIAENIEQLGIVLETSAYKDMFIVNLRSLSDSKYLSPAVALMQEIIATPTFPVENLERTKARYLLGLKKAQEDPDTIANNAFMKALYGEHPYASPTSGTLESIPTINQPDLQAFAQRYLVAQNASIAITGNISVQQAKNIANQLTSAIPKGSSAPKLPDAQPLKTGKTIHIPFDSTQTTIIMGQLGTKRSSDVQTLQQQTNFAIADEIIGGGNFQARLMSDIRKKRGLTYGIYSNMTPMQSQGSYVINFSTRNEKAEEAITATLNVINQALQQGVTENELNLTKDSLINSFPLGLASNTGINNTLGMLNFYQLPDSYLTHYIQRIQQTNLDEVNKSYRQQIDPSKFLIVTVGKQQPSIKTVKE